jgi:8-oxo-dGTP pyrophosphatase MutT (NUDIX family)
VACGRDYGSAWAPLGRSVGLPVSATEDPLPPPVPAATVIVLRDGDDGPETLLLRRDARGTFGGMWVFPGGRVDAQDWAELAPAEELAAARRAAVREAFEEAGLHLAPAGLVPYAHWTPPPINPKRFATWFFVTAAPEGEVVVDGAEVHEHAWLRPEAALRRHGAGELLLAPPTWVTLHQLTAHAGTDAALRAATASAPERFTTRPLRVGGVTVLAWHGDAAYEDGVDRDGPRHRLWMGEGTWRYERSSR